MAIDNVTKRTGPIPQIGTGVDIHPFAAGVPLRLAGLEWSDHDVGLAGQPDGDVVVHAACNALLIAANLGDLGTHFDTTLPEWASAPPTALLVDTAALVRDAGFDVGNVSVQLVGDMPRLGPRRDEAQRVLSAALGAPVFLGAATSEGLGTLGRREGIVAIATALILPVADLR